MCRSCGLHDWHNALHRTTRKTMTNQKSKEIIQTEFRRMCRGTMAFALITIGILVLFKQQPSSVVLGTVLGSCYTLFNFRMVCSNAIKALMFTKPQQAQRRVYAGYARRYLTTAIFLFLVISTPQIHLAAAVIPLVYPKLILLTSNINLRKGG